MNRLYTFEDGPRTLHKFDSAEALDAYCVLTKAGPASISVKPGTGSVTVSLSLDSAKEVLAGTATWDPAVGLGEAGVVTANVLDYLPSAVTAVRFTATTADATARVAQ